MRARSLPAVAFRAHRRASTPWLALLGLLVLALQAPVQPTCGRLLWRFTAVQIEATDAELEADDLERSPHPEALAPARQAADVVPARRWRDHPDVTCAPRPLAREVQSTRAPPLV